MTDAPKEPKKSPKRILLLVVTILIIAGLAWTSVHLIKLVPDAFSSLASLAESLNRTSSNQTFGSFGVTSDKTLVNAGESVTLSWETASRPGSYTFSYQCADGVAVDLIRDDGTQSISCDTNYNIGTVENLTIAIDSEKERYTDVTYTIAFLATNDISPRASGNASITVVNNAVSELATETTEEPEMPEEEPVEEPQEETPSETPATPAVSPTPTYEQQYTYAIPTSDPHGRTDLGVRFLNTGMIVGNTFFPQALLRGEAGAIQFEVKNFGTKTSGRWSFSVTLPTGDTYTADSQAPLKPNERAVLSIGFGEHAKSSYTFEVVVDETSDRNRLNDSFHQPVTFAR